MYVFHVGMIDVCFSYVYVVVCRCYGDVVCIAVSFTGACGVGVSDVYMLKSVGDSTPPGGTPLLNWRCVVSECGVSFAAFDVVCDVFDNGVWDVCFV